MRLTPAQINPIKSTATAVLGEGAQITLFGSRVHDDQKGGNIDLLVSADAFPEQKRVTLKVTA